MKTWAIYEIDDPVTPIGYVDAETYQQATSAALTELGYCLSDDEKEDDSEEGFVVCE